MTPQARLDGEFLRSGTSSEISSFASDNVVTFAPPAATPLPAPIPGARSLSDIIGEYEADEESAQLLASARREIAQTLYADEPESLGTLRLKAGLSQMKLAGLVGTSQRHIARIECGKADPGTDMIVRIASVLGVEGEVVFRAIRQKLESAS